MSQPRSSSTRRSSRANWKLQGILREPYMTSTSNRSTWSSGRERFGVCRMLSRQPSRKSNRPAIQGYSQAGRIPGSPVFTVVLALRGGLGQLPLFAASIARWIEASPALTSQKPFLDNLQLGDDSPVTRSIAWPQHPRCARLTEAVNPRLNSAGIPNRRNSKNEDLLTTVVYQCVCRARFRCSRSG